MRALDFSKLRTLGPYVTLVALILLRTPQKRRDVDIEEFNNELDPEFLLCEINRKE